MRNLLLTLLAAATLALASFGATAPAAAEEPSPFQTRPYDGGHPGISFHLDAYRGPVYYDRRRYYDGYVYERRPIRPRTVYRYRYPRDTYPPVYRRDPGAAVAAGIIGLATGAILGQALAAPPPAVRAPRVRYDADAIAYCARKYRSFDPNSFTFLGYDGRRHYCRIP
ncbi:BA14K family protein [Salinarimonas rosea]|uniref:BA14K family protein n=1 Tax=Salinarimonas rosea TaxID=552063 RepID=UPI0003F5C741|nr:BA14K family protein [Salinarimonas rosea]